MTRQRIDGSKPSAARRANLRPLWRCPKCGHRFVTANMWHSCSNHTLEFHFRGCDSAMRPLFEHYLKYLRSLGPVAVIPQATRISFQARVRFAGAIVRRRWVEGSLWLKRRVQDACFARVEHYGRNDWVYRFRLVEQRDLTELLRHYLREAYQVGRQRADCLPGWPRGAKG